MLLPANSTHICQLLDVAFFYPLKVKWRKIFDDWKNKHSGVLPKYDFSRLLKETIDQIGLKKADNITAGFKSRGIALLNAERVLKKVKDFGGGGGGVPGSEDETEISTRWSDTLIDYLRTTQQTQVIPTKPKGKRLNIVAGESIVPSHIATKPDPE